VVIAALLSAVEPLATLNKWRAREGPRTLALAALPLANLAFVPTMYTTHYADLFYSVPEQDRPLTFPNTPMPVFWDFSFTIAAAPRPRCHRRPTGGARS
jgi:uncharacterized membrane protein